MPIENSTSAAVGELLLKGYCMLAESCEYCQVPLMRDPATRLEHCVGCHSVFRNGQRLPGTSPQASAPMLPPAAPAPAAVASRDAAGTANGIPRAANASPSSSDDSPRLILDGPLPAPAPLAPRPPLPRSPQQAASDRAADRLSAHLLQGYRMLAASCPQCDSPLMRAPGPEGATHCVVCDLPVRTAQEAEAAASASAPPPPQPAAPAQAAASGASPPPAPAAPTVAAALRVGGADGVVLQPSAPAPAREGAAPATQPQPLASDSGMLAPPADRAPLEAAAVLEGLRQALLAKVLEAQAALCATPVSDAERHAALSRVLLGLLDTLRAAGGGAGR